MRLRCCPLSLLLPLLVSLLLTVHADDPVIPPAEEGAEDNSTVHGKLLYILLDGFRHDYVSDFREEELPGFMDFINDGVHAEYVNPIFPSISYPSWTTLSTGLYAESHNIVGNYFYDPVAKDYFSLFSTESTGNEKWWTAEPIWTTATNAGLKVGLHLWSRCDILYDGVTPESCDIFQKITGPEILDINIKKALQNFQDGYDLVHVYAEHLDNTGHTKGPESPERKHATKEVDIILTNLNKQLKERLMEDKVNVVIVSDHGMTSTGPDDVTRLELDDYLPSGVAIESIADSGAYVNIKVADSANIDQVYDALSEMEGVSVYKNKDIPEEWHVANSEYIHDIILLADIGYFIMGSNTDVQRPPRDDSYTPLGAHGYNPEEMKMKAIFYAKGPAFKKGVVLDPIDLVDVYQVVAKVLNIEPRPHNGTYERVSGAFANAAPGQLSAAIALPLMFVVVMWNTFSLGC